MVLGYPDQRARHHHGGSSPGSFSYDPRGRQTEGGGRGVVWTDFDLPKQITQNGQTTSFDYDAFGTRVRKIRNDGSGAPLASTVTLGGLYERREDLQEGTLQHVFYVHGEDGAVAQIVYDAVTDKRSTRYLQRDALGSVGLVFGNTGVEVERLFFEPFGQRIEPDGEPLQGSYGDVLVGFTGHRHDDDLGLIDMRGRVYDPLQKHFLTPDPVIQSPFFSQDLNRYSYVWNNPVSIVDPTGQQEMPRIQPLPMGPAGQIEGGSSFWERLKGWLSNLSPPSTPGPQPAPVTPSTPTADSNGATPATGPVSQPKPPDTTSTDTQSPGLGFDGDFAPYNRHAQYGGGFVAGVAIGIVPLGAVVANTLIEEGVLAKGTPEAREGLAAGQMVGGIVGLLLSGRQPSSAPLHAPRPLAQAPAGGSAAAPPLVVAPAGAGIVVGAGAIVNVAAGAVPLAAAMSGGASSQGGGGNAGSKDAQSQGGTKITSGSQVTEQVIRDAMRNAPLQSQQAGGVSLRLVQKYVDKLLAGEVAPPIKVDGNLIVDGNHRYIAGRILGREPGIQPWIGGRGPAVPWDQIKISTEW